MKAVIHIDGGYVNAFSGECKQERSKNVKADCDRLNASLTRAVKSAALLSVASLN